MLSRTTKGAKPMLDFWPSVLAILTGLALMLYTGMTLMVQNRAQDSVNRLDEKHIVGEAEKLEALLAFYFAQCRRDIAALAGSQAVAAYFTDQAHRAALKSGKPLGSHAIEKAADRWLKKSSINNRAIFNRILIIDNKRRIVYDTQEISLSAEKERTFDYTRHAATGEALHATDHEIIISTPAYRDGKVAGHVIAWLNPQAVYIQFIANTHGRKCFKNLLSNSGRIYFQDDLPKEVQACGLEAFKTISPNILTTVSMACNEHNAGSSEYLSIARPIAKTPLRVLSILPKSHATGWMKPWLHTIIIATLSIIFVSLLAFQLLRLRHTELKTRYTEADKQHRAMIENNEKLANEIILRKQAEAELKIINEHLEEIVKHRTGKLEGAMNDLRNTQSQLIQTGKLASIGELAAGIAHELNQPLMVIRGNAQLAARLIERSEDRIDQLPSFFDVVERNTKRMIMIINHLRSFSRQSGTEMQSVDINQVINDAFLMIGEQLRLRNIETVKTLSENLPFIKGDPYQLEQVVLNLLTNARDAIEAYQPVENEYRRKKQIEITTRLQDGSEDTMEILFSDTGCGIDQENREKIFDPFFTTKAVGKGTGLGLSITYGILQEHNGHLDILDTKPGHTTVRIVLPAQHDATGRPHDQVQPSQH